MRAWWVIVLGCGGSTGTISNPSTGPVRPTPCGFTDLATLDREVWKAVNEIGGDKPRPVGSCLLHAIDPQQQRFLVREGSLDIAQVTRDGTMLLVAGMPVGGFEVGMSSDVVLDRHSPDDFRIGCGPTRLGTLCGFLPVGVEGHPRFEFLVGGEPQGNLQGLAAYEFFRHKPLRGVFAHAHR